MKWSFFFYSYVYFVIQFNMSKVMNLVICILHTTKITHSNGVFTCVGLELHFPAALAFRKRNAIRNRVANDMVEFHLLLRRLAGFAQTFPRCFALQRPGIQI